MNSLISWTVFHLRLSVYVRRILYCPFAPNSTVLTFGSLLCCLILVYFQIVSRSFSSFCGVDYFLRHSIIAIRFTTSTFVQHSINQVVQYSLSPLPIEEETEQMLPRQSHTESSDIRYSI